jgi:hypothetical protein
VAWQLHIETRFYGVTDTIGMPQTGETTSALYGSCHGYASRYVEPNFLSAEACSELNFFTYESPRICQKAQLNLGIKVPNARNKRTKFINNRASSFPFRYEIHGGGNYSNNNNNKLHGLSLRANYDDRVTVACRRS